MNAFTQTELDYLLGERRLARVATVGPDGTPHVVPVGWSLNRDEGVIEVSGHDFADTKKFRDVAATSKAAIVIDDVVQPPWQPRGVTVRGRADAITDDGGARIRIHPDRVVSWGLGS